MIVNSEEMDIESSSMELNIVTRTKKTLPKVPIKKKLGPPVIILESVSKREPQILFTFLLFFLRSNKKPKFKKKQEYTIEGREEAVKALENINLAFNNEFYPIRELKKKTKKKLHKF